MHVEWGWIKQRPHFIAEELSKHFSIRVYYQTIYSNFRRNKNSSNIKRTRLLNIPMRSFRLLGEMDKILTRLIVKNIVKWGKYDVIWVTHPSHVDYLNNICIPIIYDCMDDHAHFSISDAPLKEKEIQLFKLASLVTFSSNRLSEINNTLCRNSLILLNGISDNIASKVMESNDNSVTEIRNIFYFGTIASWFDFDTVSRILDNCPNVVFNIIGPSEVELVNHPRIYYHGSVDHSDLVSIIESADAFIMPFLRNNLIESVDPVKMYEYIATCKPIISVYYNELDKFDGFVNFYSNTEEILLICEKINNSTLKTYERGEAIDFLLKSTWSERTNSLVRALEGIL
jgi:teichuronic acid biosynthesis glycosyltransferase TuaH